MRARQIVCGCLLGLLISCPASFGQEPTIIDSVQDGGDYYVWPTQTVNLVTGGQVTNLYVWPGGTLNIHGGTVAGVLDVSEGAVVTIFGKTFTVSSGPFADTYAEPGTYAVELSSTVDGPLEGLYEDETDVSLNIACAPGQTVVLEVSGVDEAPGGTEGIEIKIRPGCEDNCLNLQSNGVVPVVIFSTADFDATVLDPANIFLAGAGVRTRSELALRQARRRSSGRGARGRSGVSLHGKWLAALETGDQTYLANSQDVNGDGLPDLVVKIEAKDLDPEQFINGRAYLRVHETSDPQSAVLYEGYEAITAVPAE